MTDKYLTIDASSGQHKERASINSSAGAGDAGKIPALDATGRLHTNMMPVGLGADIASLPATENLASGDVVNIWNNAGVSSVRKADASVAGKEADGFVLAAVTSGSTASVYLSGPNTSLASLTLGSRYFLSASTPGTVTTTPPSGSGNVVQFVGRSVNATTLNFEPDPGTILA